MDLFRAMEVFVRVVDTGSLTAAARKCGISATMVGQYLQALENRLGASLLHRTTRRQRLTELGNGYYQRCLEILGSVADADALAEESRGEPHGRLRVTAPASFGTETLMPAMSDYLARYPAVELDMVFSNAIADLVEDGFDAAIRLGALPDSGLIARPLAPERMTICAAPSYLARKGEPAAPEDLTAHDCLAFGPSDRLRWNNGDTEWQMTGPAGVKSVRVGGRIKADGYQALHRAALSGLGVVMLPSILVSGDIAAGRLVRLLLEWEARSYPVHIIYLPDRRVSRKLRTFVDFVIERFGTPLPEQRADRQNGAQAKPAGIGRRRFVGGQLPTK